MAGKVNVGLHRTGHASQTQWYTHLLAQWHIGKGDEHPAYALLEYYAGPDFAGGGPGPTLRMDHHYSLEQWIT